jgi:crossover junction endodeoxyribonuclease RusA
VNHYWRRVGPRTLISREGRAFREKVCSILAASGCPTIAGPLAVKLDAYPPDRRRRDLDNLPKGALDALEKGGAYADDGQIDLLVVCRQEPVEGGRLIVRLYPYPLLRCPLCGGPW